MQINRNRLVKIAIPLALLVGLATIIWLGPKRTSGDVAQGDWTCSMHPQIRQPRPGQCPICGMNLIPVAQLATEQAGMPPVGVETEAVALRELFKEIRTVGKIDYNERRMAFISARIAGRVDRVYADFTGIQVKVKDHLVDIYSPDLFVAQDELIRSLDAFEKVRNSPAAERDYAARLLEASRTKLLLWNMLPEQLKEIETTRKVRTHLTLFAPIGGTVIEKNVREGQYVKEGDMLYRIADLDPIWLFLDIYEFDLGWVRYGQQVDVTLEAYPGETFRGTVVFIDPFLDDKTRTVKVRVNLKNPERRLKAGMYASATIRIRLRADGTPEPTGIEGKYICPMHPEVVQDKAGRCTICEMALEKVPEAKPVRLPVGKKRGPGSPEHKHPSPEQKLPPPEHKQPPGEHKQPAAEPGKVLAVRASAVLDTGRRQVVYREKKPGDYDLVEVQLGLRAEGKDDGGQKTSYFPVLAGLKGGDRVIIQGGFLIDSQHQIEGRKSLLFPQGQGGANLHSGHGAPPAPPSPGGAHKH